METAVEATVVEATATVVEATATVVEATEAVITPIVATPTDAQKADKELQELFQVVIGKIRLSVANQQLTTDSFTAILLKVVETIEEMSHLHSMSGIEKRSIAINLTNMIIEDLHKNGQISDDIYKTLMLSVGFLAPLIFTAAKDAWNKLQEIGDDIELHGCKGCFGRNCKTKTTRSRK